MLSHLVSFLIGNLDLILAIVKWAIAAAAVVIIVQSVYSMAVHEASATNYTVLILSVLYLVFVFYFGSSLSNLRAFFRH